MSVGSASKATSPLAFNPAVNSFHETSQNLKQIQEKLNAMAAHLGTKVATVTQIASQGNSLASILAELATLSAEIAAIQAQLGETFVAQAAVTKYQVVYESGTGVVQAADVTVAASAVGVVGLAAASAATGASLTVSIAGATVTNPAWAWAVGPVYADIAGGLTQSPKGAGAAVFMLLVGFAVSPTSVLVAPGEPEFFATNNDGALLQREAAGQLQQAWLPLLPCLSAIPAGKTVTIPSGSNLLTLASRGLANAGSIVNHGSIVMVPA